MKRRGDDPMGGSEGVKTTRRRRRRQRRPYGATAPDDDDAMTMRRRRDDATTTRRRQRDAGSRCRTGALLVHDPTVTGAQQVHGKVPAKVHDDKVRDKARHGGTRRGRRGAKHAHGTTRHSSLEQMSERRTRAQKGTATCSEVEVRCHPTQVPSPPVQR